jgi:hypothetical protein
VREMSGDFVLNVAMFALVVAAFALVVAVAAAMKAITARERVRLLEATLEGRMKQLDKALDEVLDVNNTTVGSFNEWSKSWEGMVGEWNKAMGYIVQEKARWRVLVRRSKRKPHLDLVATDGDADPGAVVVEFPGGGGLGRTTE